MNEAGGFVSCLVRRLRTRYLRIPVQGFAFRVLILGAVAVATTSQPSDTLQSPVLLPITRQTTSSSAISRYVRSDDDRRRSEQVAFRPQGSDNGLGRANTTPMPPIVPPEDPNHPN